MKVTHIRNSFCYRYGVVDPISDVETKNVLEGVSKGFKRKRMLCMVETDVISLHPALESVNSFPCINAW